MMILIHFACFSSDMKEGAPLVIKGIVKGSAAHRSGQVFPKDEIRSLKYKGKEIYDPLTSDFTRERTVILTIMRDLRKGKKSNFTS